jgi:hypothetical protein
MGAAFQLFQPGLQAVAFGLGETGAYIADVDQLPGLRVVRAQQQAAHPAAQPALAWPVAADDHLGGLDEWVFEERVGAFAGGVAGVAAFGDQALVATRDNMLQQMPRTAAVGGQLGEGEAPDDRHPVGIRHRQRHQLRTAHVIGLGQQRGLAELEQVEGEKPDLHVVEGLGTADGGPVGLEAAATFLQ